MDMQRVGSASDHFRKGRELIGALDVIEACRNSAEARQAVSLLSSQGVLSDRLETGLVQRLEKAFGQLPKRRTGTKPTGPRIRLPQGWSDLELLGYITPVENLASIVEHGVLSHNAAARMAHSSVADKTIQEIRDSKKVMGRVIHDYANVYLNPRNAMLYRVIHERRVDDVAVLWVDARQVLALPGVVVTDRNAATSRVLAYTGVQGLTKLDKEDVLAERWTVDGKKMIDREQRMMAEVLVPGMIPPWTIVKATVIHSMVAQRLRKLSLPIKFDSSEWLFFNGG